MLTGLENFRDVLLVALLLGLGYVLLRRMAFAMRKHETQPGIVDLHGAGAWVEASNLVVRADIQGAGVDDLCVKVIHGSGESILHNGPAGGGEVTWEWPIPESLQGQEAEVHLTAPRSKVMRRLVLS